MADICLLYEKKYAGVRPYISKAQAGKPGGKRGQVASRIR
jgi:hypothetical protein